MTAPAGVLNSNESASSIQRGGDLRLAPTPRRVLVVHNRYLQRGGEDSVVESEIALLRAKGHDVQEWTRDNTELKEMSALVAAGNCIWSRGSARTLSSLLASFRPDVAHVHNTFPLLSPSVYWACAGAGVPVVQTLHNFRLLCAAGTFLRNDQICERCLGKLPFQGVAHACYRGSVSQSAVLVAMLGVHRAFRTYQTKIARYIALSDFAKSKFTAGGLPVDRIVVKPNFVDLDTKFVDAAKHGGIYVGRLAAEKGVECLTRALQRAADVDFTVHGSGPMLDQTIEALGPQRVRGALGAENAISAIGGARYLVVPSIWYEGFPRVVAEAFACGTPVIASDLGTLAEVVENGKTGLLFEAGSSDALYDCIVWASENPSAMARMGRAARSVFEERYSAAVNYDQLTAIYRAAIADSQRGAS